MPLYQCRVVDALGQNKRITKEAIDEISLRATLKRDNIILLKATIVKEKEPNTFFAVSSKVKRTEVVTFLRQFSVMIKAAIPISDALNVLRNQKFSKAFQKVLMTIYQDVQSGVLLSEAFRKHKKVFPEFFVNMVSIGEVSGSLDKVLESMADYYENDRKIKRKAKSAMTYPMILLVLIVIVAAFVTLFILPQFQDTIAELGGDVPGITLALMAFSNFVRRNIGTILVAIVAIGFAGFLFFKKTNKGRYIWDYIKLHLPMIGTISRNLITTRFSKAFIILLESGMNITDCLENLRKMLGNQVFSEKFKYTTEEVRRGRRIAVAMEHTKIFPSILTEMINVGEKSGNIEEVLKSTSDYFDECVEDSISKATASLEPLMIVFLGIVVGVVLLAVFLPIISLMNSI